MGYWALVGGDMPAHGDLQGTHRQLLGCPDELRPVKDSSRDGLADYYLRELTTFGGRESPPEQFLSDFRLIWHVYKLNVWDLLPHEVGGMGY